jgi:hypothetical protein
MSTLHHTPCPVHIDPSFALDLADAVPPPPDGWPTGADQAWEAGYSLGYDGIAADPPHGYSPYERDQFAAGQDAGFRAREREDLAPLTPEQFWAEAEIVAVRGASAYRSEGGW